MSKIQVDTIVNKDDNGAPDFPNGATVTGIVTATSFVGDGSGLTGAGPTVGIDTTTNDTFYPLFAQTTSGIVTSSSVADSKLTFNPSLGKLTTNVVNSTSSIQVNDTVIIDEGRNIQNVDSLKVLGITTSNETRFLSVAERIEIIDGNTVSIAYTSTGSNIGFCTNPSGDISLSVTDIPTDSSFDKHAISFSILVNQTGTARTCTSVSLNGVPATIKWSGGSLSEAISGITTTNGYDIYSFVGFNTVGSASTTDNYEVLGAVSGGFN